MIFLGKFEEEKTVQNFALVRCDAFLILISLQVKVLHQICTISHIWNYLPGIKKFFWKMAENGFFFITKMLIGDLTNKII